MNSLCFSKETSLVPLTYDFLEEALTFGDDDMAKFDKLVVKANDNLSELVVSVVFENLEYLTDSKAVSPTSLLLMIHVSCLHIKGFSLGLEEKAPGAASPRPKKVTSTLSCGHSVMATAC